MRTLLVSRGAALLVFLGLSVAWCAADAGAAKTRPTLRFRPVLLEPSKVPPSATSTTSDPAADAVVASCNADAVAAMPSVPTTRSAKDTRAACVILPDKDDPEQRWYLGPAALAGNAIRSATPEFISTQGWTLKMDLTRDGSSQWDQLAEQQFHKMVAIVLDGEVLSAPTIQPDQAAFSSFGGTAVVSGGGPDGFTQREAKRIAALVAVAR